MGSVATRYSHEAGKQRDELARGRETVGHFAAIIADVPVRNRDYVLNISKFLATNSSQSSRIIL